MNVPLPLSDTEDAPRMGNDYQPSEVERARALVVALSAAGRRSTAEVLHELRQAFPHSPLAMRVRALEALRGR
jgi:hypothetical protein